jgi:hypothetical protein
VLKIVRQFASVAIIYNLTAYYSTLFSVMNPVSRGAKKPVMLAIVLAIAMRNPEECGLRSAWFICSDKIIVKTSRLIATFDLR